MSKPTRSFTGNIVLGAIFSTLSFASLAAAIVGLVFILTDTFQNSIVPIILEPCGYLGFVIFGFVAYHFWKALEANGVRGAKAMRFCSIVQYYILYYLIYAFGAIIGGIISVVCILFGKDPPKKNKENENEAMIRDERGNKITVRKTTLQERHDGEWYTCWTDTASNVYLSKDGKHFFKRP